MYEFSTDLDAPNKMDEKPFLVLDLAAVDAHAAARVGEADQGVVRPRLGHQRRGRAEVHRADQAGAGGGVRSPSTEWVEFFASRVYEKSVTAKVREQFETLVPKAATQFLTEQVNERLKTALGDDAAAAVAPAAPAPQRVTTVAVQETVAADGGDAESTKLVVTTDEEIEGFQIVRAIVCSEVAVERVAARDTQTYFGVLLDDNNRKPVARLWFNRTQKYLGILDENETETRLPIDSPQDIYAHADTLPKTVADYLSRESGSSAE